MTGVVRLRRISLAVVDLAASARFYTQDLGFRSAGEPTLLDPAMATLLAIPDLQARSTSLSLGRGELELVQFEPAGLPYPAPRTAADPWFQHFAIVVRDMTKAYATLRDGREMSEISTGGPQLLPPNTGSVTAFKFRDPDGHPLELSMFPPGVGSPWWHEPSQANSLGIDHSAIAVADVDASLAFYVGLLGMSVTSRGVNQGVEQDRLDGLASDGVEIVVVQPADPESAHMELLRYPPAVRPGALAASAPNDVTATRLTFEVESLAALVERLRAAGVAFVSPGAVELETSDSAALVRDPDGHLIELTGR